MNALNKIDQEYKSYFNFIHPNDDPMTRHTRARLRMTPPLHISTDTLSLSSYTTSIEEDLHDNDDIFKQLNFPNLKKALYSPSSDTWSNNSSPQLAPAKENEQETKHLMKLTTVELSPAASFLAGFMRSPSTATASNVVPIAMAMTEEDQVIHDYTIGDTIGYGGFSIVRKAQHGKTQEVVAVKIINQYLLNDIERTRLERELHIWKSLNHPRIIQLKKVYHENQKCYIVCDLCDQGNLLEFLNNVKKLNELEAKKIFKEICQGVYYLHIDRQVCHKDLKLDNILLDEQGHVKICDFGLAIYQKRKGQEDEAAGGSLAYASPEQIKQEAPLTCPKTDIWSLGVILYALVVGHLPFTDAYDLRLQQKILQGQYDIPHHLSLSLKTLIQQCLAYDPEERSTIDQVLNSSWLK